MDPSRDRYLLNWKLLILAALNPRSSRPGATDLPSSVPASLARNNIDTVLEVANAVQYADANVSRILCEHAYSLSQSLDPKSQGRGVLQFKTGLMSVIKQKLAKKDGTDFYREQDIVTLQNFYRIQKDQLAESGLENRSQRRKIFTTLRVLRDVINALASTYPTQLNPEFKKEMELDAKTSEAFQPYNILPLEAPGVSDQILNLPEIKAARLAIQCSGLRFGDNFDVPQHRKPDIFDALHYAFGFQKDNVRNQREHFLLLLANAQSQRNDSNVPRGFDQELDEDVIKTLCSKILANYEKWCRYIRKTSVYGRVATKKDRVALVALYLCIWGEAANVRFLPEGICFIYHYMANELFGMLAHGEIEQKEQYRVKEKQSFLETVITPIYNALKEETLRNGGGKAGHSKWRNYDDFNEFFWSPSCFNELKWPFSSMTESPFLSKPVKEVAPKNGLSKLRGVARKPGLGKTSFVEHRTFFHLYHSFLRVWILLVLMLQGLTIIAFSENLNMETLKVLLSLGVTYFIMKLIESVLDVILMVGAYRSSRKNAMNRIFAQLIFFGGCAGGSFYLYLKMMLGENAFFHIYLLVLGVYAAVQLFVSLILHIPLLREWSEESDRFRVMESLKWLFQERYFVGRGLYERPSDYIRYVLFWVVVLVSKFIFSYFLQFGDWLKVSLSNISMGLNLSNPKFNLLPQIKPLVGATNSITSYSGEINYKWHDLVSKDNHNALTVFFLWAPIVLIYLLDISIWYTIWSAFLGGLIGAKDRLGEIRSIEMLRNRFDTFPEAFVKNLEYNQQRNSSIEETIQSKKEEASVFAPFWNEIINCLRAEDYVTNREKDLLIMPSNKGNLNLVQWPLFLLVSKVFLAMELAMEKKENTEELWEKLGKDPYMSCAVKEVYESVKLLLNGLLFDDDMKWFQKLFNDAEEGVHHGTFFTNFQMSNLQNVVTRITALTGLLVKASVEESRTYSKSITEALNDLWLAAVKFSLRPPLGDGPSFRGIQVLKPEQRESIKRLHSLLFIKESASTIPKNLEARRRLEFFTNSLFMNMPPPPPVRAMKSFSVYTPYYSEIVMYSMDELRKENEDGISTLFYLQKIFPDEWKNFLERIGLIEATFEAEFDKGELSPDNVLKLRLWASYRGQTLARTVRGMMYYRRALMLQSFIENPDPGTVDFEKSKLAKAYADLKFVYVITCQIYGQQKAKLDPKAVDILHLLKENEGLRVAYIHEVDKDYYSKLVKSDGDKDQVIYSIKLPGNPILGEGKPENQNHAVIFTRGDAIQTIDMNQDNYFEEALKMRNLLQEFEENHGIRPATILGVREHVFTGSVSSLAWFMSNQETSFVTLGQRVLARPLKVRMHYGHPDVFDRIFHLTRGGFSKASKVINISEDIFAGFNSTLRQGNVTHHEYIQVGKGRDVGLNQIALFEAKVSSGNGEQCLSRDVYRLGQLLDFFRMLSFYVTSVGYYVCTMLTVLVVYVFLYGKAYLALSGVGQSLSTLALVTNNQALQSALNTQFLFQIGVFTAIPMLMGFILEQGVLKAIVSFVTMQLQLCSVFFTFSLGTRTHYFGRTILHGGAKYRATGRGFVVQHIKFAENYRLYSRSHFVKALEIIMLLLVYLAYGFETSSLGYLLLSFSSWFLALSWLFAPYIFNPSGFEWQKTVDDFDDWANWLLYRGGVGVKADDSWETWWEEEHEHIRSMRGRILETILSVRFFFFQYGVVYHLHAASGNTTLTVYGVSWLVLGGIVLIFKVFSFNPKASVNFQMFLRLIQGIVFLMIIMGLAIIVAFTPVTVGDLFASILALVPTGWGILSIAIAWKDVVNRFRLWTSLRLIARFYDAAMGMVIFFPIAFLSWFPFVSTFQTRLVFNQAFSRGLEISLILAGNRPNVQV